MTFKDKGKWFSFEMSFDFGSVLSLVFTRRKRKHKHEQKYKRKTSFNDF